MKTGAVRQMVTYVRERWVARLGTGGPPPTTPAQTMEPRTVDVITTAPSVALLALVVGIGVPLRKPSYTDK